MKFTVLSLLALATTATAENPFDLEMEWYSTSALPGDCSTEDKRDIDAALLEDANTVLNSAGYDEFDDMIDDRRRNLRKMQSRCGGPPRLCNRPCKYSQHLCVLLYQCDCRRRVLIGGEMPSRELQSGLVDLIKDMCETTLAAKSSDDGISGPCQTALLGNPGSVGCSVALTPVAESTGIASDEDSDSDIDSGSQD